MDGVVQLGVWGLAVSPAVLVQADPREIVEMKRISNSAQKTST